MNYFLWFSLVFAFIAGLVVGDLVHEEDFPDCPDLMFQSWLNGLNDFATRRPGAMEAICHEHIQTFIEKRPWEKDPNDGTPHE